MKKAPESLASVLMSISKTGERMDEISKGLLAFVKARNVVKLEELNREISEAYKANGWSQKIGRPALGSTDQGAPKAVRVYVSQLRAGYDLQLPVWEYPTMGALKLAVNEARAKLRPAKEQVPPELEGIKLASENKLIGALFHDVAVLWKNLPEDQRPAVEKRLRRLVNELSRNPAMHLVGAA